MLDNHYVNPELVELYDLDSPWSDDREFYLSLANGRAKNILDLGCGTGLIANAYAKNGHSVTGVDPSPLMLECGRKKEFGNQIEWVESSSQNFNSEKRFDLIIMTGHAFQVLLDDSDINQTFKTMAEHLTRDGTIVFESRNPVKDWPSQWNYDMDLNTSNGTVHESRRFLKMEKDRMTFELRYEFPDENLTSKSELRFLNHEEISHRLSKAGLKHVKTFGDWDKSPFKEESSEEMIFFAGL